MKHIRRQVRNTILLVQPELSLFNLAIISVRSQRQYFWRFCSRSSRSCHKHYRKLWRNVRCLQADNTTFRSRTSFCFLLNWNFIVTFLKSLNPVILTSHLTCRKLLLRDDANWNNCREMDSFILFSAIDNFCTKFYSWNRNECFAIF